MGFVKMNELDEGFVLLPDFREPVNGFLPYDVRSEIHLGSFILSVADPVRFVEYFCVIV